MTLRRFIVLGLVFAAFQAQAAPRAPQNPDVSLVVNYDEGKIRYRHKTPYPVPSDKSVAGYTRTQPYGAMRVSGAGASYKIVLDVGFKPFFVDISSLAAFGSCDFDLILKHELTHVALYRAVMDEYIRVIGASLKRRLESELRKGKEFSQITSLLSRTFNDSFAAFAKDANAQNSLLDKNYAYQWGQCRGKN